MAFTGTSQLADQVQTAYDRAAFFAYRAGEVFGQFARTKPGNPTSPGSSVQFLFWTDLSAATTALSETVDVTPVALADTTTTLTPQEHGNVVLTTLKVRSDTLIAGFDSDVANLVSYNMMDSIETLAAEAIEAGASTTTVDGNAEGSLTAADVITMNKLREQVAIMRGGNVGPISASGQGPTQTAPGSTYAAIIHPDVSYDLMTATADTDWAAFVVRQAGDEWRNGEVARAAGLSFFETSRAQINVDGGASTEDVYSTYVLGQDGLGKAVSVPPHIVMGPVTDYLKRFVPIGWHAYLDHGVIRQEGARNLLAVSSIGSN